MGPDGATQGLEMVGELELRTHRDCLSPGSAPGTYPELHIFVSFYRFTEVAGQVRVPVRSWSWERGLLVLPGRGEGAAVRTLKLGSSTDSR